MILAGRISQDVYLLSGHRCLEHHAPGAALVTRGRWNGDLHRFSTRVWDDDSPIAAIAVASGQDGAGWLNLRHVKPRYHRMVMLWCWNAAFCSGRAPFDVLYEDELPDWPLDASEEVEAE